MFGYSESRSDEILANVPLACPPKYGKDGKPNPMVLRWSMDALEMGHDFLKSQAAYPDIDKAIEIICGIVNDRIPKKLSRVRANVIKRDVRELCAIQSNLKPFWLYEAENPDMEQFLHINNSLTQAWFNDTYVDRTIKEALQWAATSKGYIEPYWGPDPYRKGRNEVLLRTLGPKDVLPVHLESDNDLQNAYAVVIKRRMSIIRAWRNWPEYRDQLKPTRWPTRGLARIADAMFNSPFLSWMRRGDSDENDQLQAFPTIDVYYIYVNDWSVNYTTKEVSMGRPGEPWFYTVPAIGQKIMDGYRPNGTKREREATEDDCYLYPLRRLIKCTDKCVMYDDTSPWWHGQVPAIPFSIDKWVFQYLGFSLARDVAGLQNSMVSMMRAVDDTYQARLNPAKIFNKNAGIAKGDAERFSFRIPGNTMMGNLDNVNKVVEVPLAGTGLLDVPQGAQAAIDWFAQRIDHDIGLPDNRNLMKAKQIPGSDTQQKILELTGPLAEDMSRETERGLRQLGHQVKYFQYEFYTAARRYKIGGPDLITPHDFDFEPGLMFPSHMPDEDPEAGPSRYTRVERARYWADFVTFKVAPGSLNNITSMTHKLLTMQLQKAGFPISWWDLGDALGYEVGGRPSGIIEGLDLPGGKKLDASTFLGRFVYQKAILEPQIAKLIATNGPLPPVKQPGGRPQSLQQPPRQEVKDGGTRAVVTTAK